MSAVSTRSLFPTPLHARTAELCGTNQWVTVGGFTVPQVYTSEQEEIEAITARAGLSDLSARQCLRFDGPDAAAFLSFALTSDVSSLENGQTARAVWCDDEGQVRGDGQLVRYGKAHYELSTSVRDFAWFHDGARGFDVRATNVTGQRAGIGIRGPLSQALLAAAGFAAPQGQAPALTAGEGVAALPAPAWRQTQVALVRDSTGEGHELWTHADDGIVVWDRLLRVGAALGVAPVGAAVLDVVRIEHAVPLAGVDWLPAQFARHDLDVRLPRDVGVMSLAPRRFNGSWALGRATGPGSQKLVQLASSVPLTPGTLVSKGAQVGTVTSAAWSPARNKGFAIGWLKTELCVPAAPLQVTTGSAVTPCQVARDCYL
jgi:aminomethyltransferase